MENKDREELKDCTYMGGTYSPGEDICFPDHCVVCRHDGEWGDVPVAQVR